ncbi:Aste57867_20806 [Aphanomyces stellatus]|uniref:Aste57867_20806 protein n=1 Tax=Aphanomyces stellatus TaxID=120398 RepID=A0A485LGK5_9STRA|nr:hypothetical protein As57867_020738 [Aphanomyces stellatus]VFT97485.1 Aste57867_20806 [Aphanomyces stellatus]
MTLTPGQFDCPALSPSEAAAFLTLGETVCRDTLQNALTMQKQRVASVAKNATTRRHATIHKGFDVVDPSLPGTCARTTIAASLADVADFFYLDSPHKLDQYAFTMGQKIADRRNLYTLVSPDEAPMHYCGIAWMRYDVPKLFASRDMCVIEYHNEIEVVDDELRRRRGWVRCMHSIDLRCCPPLKAAHGIVRGTVTRTGYVFLETDVADVLDLFSVVVAQAHGNLVTPLALALAKRQCQMVLQLEEYFSLQRVMRTMASLDQHVVGPTTTCSYCTKCHRNFGLFLRTFHCRACLQTTCNDCGHEWTLPLHGVPVKVFVCHACFCPQDPTSRHVRTDSVQSSLLSANQLQLAKDRIMLSSEWGEDDTMRESFSSAKAHYAPASDVARTDSSRSSGRHPSIKIGGPGGAYPVTFLRGVQATATTTVANDDYNIRC